ncbi:MAG: hypothetical protein HOA04_00110 [Euryarchaeota archaeon]|nr:hypothetical protein [Euryarchaeota archaeon]
MPFQILNDDEYPQMPGFEDHLGTVLDGNSDCLEDKFLKGEDDDDCWSPSGIPVIVVPKNWPPRKAWGPSETKPVKAIIYLDDLIEFHNGHPYPFHDHSMMMDIIDPWAEISAIARNCRNHVMSITIFSSHWAASSFFNFTTKKGNSLTTSAKRFIDGINSANPNILFKFVISRAERSNKKPSVVKFLYG